MEPSVAVVILNWNGRALLERFLPSVVQTEYPNLQLIVGDNASTDDSVAFVREHYPQVSVLTNEQNHGFAGGYNRILSRVNADYYVLLNSDVEVPQNWIKPVIDLMQSDQTIGAAQPKIKWATQKDQFEYAGAAGGFVDAHVFPFCRGRIFDQVETDHGQYDENLEVFWASGAAFFIKKSVWNEVGGLDVDLFAHMEEIDLCWRLKNLGYKVMCCAGAEVYHLGGGTLSANNPFKTYLNFRNNLMIMQKNLPKAEAYRRIFIRLWYDLAAWLQFLLKGKPKFTLAISKAHFHFFRQLGQTARKRGARQLGLKQHQGVYKGSIVWAYFVHKVRKFSELNLKNSSL